MVGRNEHVAQILIPTAATALLAAGSRVTALANGQLGIFDTNTGLSINAASAPAVRSFFMAVGRQINGSATVNAVDMSAGQEIQKKNITGYTYREHSAARPHIVDVTNPSSAECGTDYCIKIKYENEETRAHLGFTPYNKSYVIKTECCDDCADCGSGDVLDVVVKMKAAINGDDHGFATAILVANQQFTNAIHGTAGTIAINAEVPDSDVAAILAFNAANVGSEVYFRLRITSTPLVENASNEINSNYYQGRGTKLVVSLGCGYDCNTGGIVEVQTLTYEEGSGYDIRQKEFRNMSHGNVSPYKKDDMGFNTPGMVWNALAATNYNQLVIEYSNTAPGTGGVNGSDNNMRTIIATTITDASLEAAILAVTDALTGDGFDPLADDAAAADANAANVDLTQDAASESVDGLG